MGVKKIGVVTAEMLRAMECCGDVGGALVMEGVWWGWRGCSGDGGGAWMLQVLSHHCQRSSC